MTDKSVAAKKAAVTRRARKAFSAKYGQRTVDIVTRLNRGQTSKQIASALNVSVATVAAVKANWRRDIYVQHEIASNLL